MEKQQYIEAGKIVNTHGVRGEVKIQVWLDSPEFMRRFKTVYIDSKPVGLLSSRAHKGFLIAMLDGVEDINAAMSLKNKTVYIDRADAKLKKEDILETPASSVYIVRGETEHMIPAVPEFVLKTDAENGIITVRLIEGM